MPVNDTFHCEVEMPGGRSDLRIALRSRGTLLFGIVDGPFGKYTFHDGTIIRNNITWTINLKSSLGRDADDTSSASSKGFINRLAGFVSASLSGPPLGTPPRPLWKRPKKDMFVEFDGRLAGGKIYGDMKFGKFAIGKFRGLSINDPVK